MKKAAFLAATLVASGLLAAKMRMNPCAWRKWEGNPVLGNAGLGTCFDVNVVTDGPAPFTMYFSWRPKRAIALVRSDDAFYWTQNPEICLEANPESGWEDDINRSCTVFRDGVWHMWYTGQAKGGSKIGYAKSSDGVHFVRVRRDPVLVPEMDYEKRSTMNPYVRWDEDRKVWRMWYAAGETYEPNVLCYAESDDGLKWRKWEGNPMFGHGPRDSWDRDRVGACEVHPLPDGRWAMFYIGYSDVDTARIGCAISADGLTGWRRLPQNPIIAPDICTWDSSATYKPSVVCDETHDRWMLWYNGRNGRSEYVGCAIHDGLDLETPPKSMPDTKALLSEYVRRFNRTDDELYTNTIPNSAAEKFMLANVPRFACPDKDIERTYYFRWWTFRKHLKRGEDGGWRVTEFLPNVSWSGTDNTIVCPAGHHFREGRWLRDPSYLRDNARFWLSSDMAKHRWQYSSWLFTGTCQLAEISGLDDLPVELLDDAVRYYTRWEEGFERSLWPGKGKGRMGGDGHGGFLSIDNYEGSEFSLGGSGWKPLMNSAMWSEAKNIAAVARRAGRVAIADKFEAKAEGVRRTLMEKCWSGDVGFFTTRSFDGVLGTVRELHGYAPWYFGVPVGVGADWSQLSDPQGFAARYGLSFPERRAKGFCIAYDGHECQWNGPSWPFATSIALTALANDLHARSSLEARKAFDFLVWQYAAQHKMTRPRSEDWKVVPWIDENLNPDKPDWISRTLLLERKKEPRERGKDYNHSTFCDLVISGVVGFLPNGSEGFTVDPLANPAWDYFMLDNLRYRGHEISIRYMRDEGFSVMVDGKVTAKRSDMGSLRVRAKEMQLNPLFSDNMVLAAGKPIRVFGSGDGEAIVRIDGREVCVQSTNGSWLVEMPGIQNEGKAYEMEVSLNGKSRTIRNVRIGEVWLMSGQSNMQFKLKDESGYPGNAADDADIAYFNCKRPGSPDRFGPKDGWVVAAKDRVGDWSALGWLFARERKTRSRLPVGIVCCCQGASTVQAWLPNTVASENRYQTPRVEMHTDHFSSKYHWNKPFGQLYEKMFRTIVPYSFSGVIWYQGESNTGKGEYKTYPDLLERMIGIWRSDLCDSVLPFTLVRIADFDSRADDGWRSIQRAIDSMPMRCKGVRVVSNVVIPSETREIHPPTKSGLAHAMSESVGAVSTLEL